MVSDAELAIAALTNYAPGDFVLHTNGRLARVLNTLPGANARLGFVWVQWLTPRYGAPVSRHHRLDGGPSPVYVARHNVRIWHGEQ